MSSRRPVPVVVWLTVKHFRSDRALAVARASSRCLSTRRDRLAPHDDRRSTGSVAASSCDYRYPLPSPSPSVDFGDDRIAVRGKKTSEILRSWFVYKLFTSDFVVDNSLKLFSLAKRLMGKRLRDRLVKATVFGHFIGGESEEDMVSCAKKLASNNISSAWNYSVESDSSAVVKTEQEMREKENMFNRHNQHYLKSFELSAKHNNAGNKTRFAAIKLTAIVDTLLLRKLNSMVTASNQVFHSLSSSPTTEDPLGRAVSLELLKEKFPTVFKDTYRTSKSKTLNMVEWTGNLSLAENASRYAEILKGKEGDNLATLSDLELQQLNGFVHRLREMGEYACSEGVRVLVDAEQTYYQEAINHMAVHHLARRYNTGPAPVFYNTLQIYLRKSYDDLRIHLASTSHYGVKSGIKIVRGAYMEQEREEAESRGVASPIHPDKPSTDRSYHRSLGRLLESVRDGDACVLIGSHNQDTIQFALERMRKLGLSYSDGSVTFGQVFGTGDQITYSLAHAGYITNKVVPYGSVEEVMPYLSRRAQENRAVMETAKADREMYSRELRRRIFPF